MKHETTYGEALAEAWEHTVQQQQEEVESKRQAWIEKWAEWPRCRAVRVSRAELYWLLLVAGDDLVTFNIASFLTGLALQKLERLADGCGARVVRPGGRELLVSLKDVRETFWLGPNWLKW